MHRFTLIPLFLLTLSSATAIPNPKALSLPNPEANVGAAIEPISLVRKADTFFEVPKSTSNTFADYAFEKCKELGIDPHGPHPDDYKKDDGKGKTFEAGSKFSFWAGAQVSEKMNEKKGGRKRQTNTISVTMWTDWDCSMNGYHVDALDQHLGQKFFDPDPTMERYSLSITSGNVDPNVWRIHLKTWTGPGTSDCLETHLYEV
ncbi:hypothetical protein K440DRAFT_646197 [Wilcoxina mikolae CBS 423.85]|nr:hypothetical protein K440DRAFT_646197 [Wilcoxina mikolae CBS 423.85]